MSIRIETAFHDAASLYHQNSTGKQKIINRQNNDPS